MPRIKESSCVLCVVALTPLIVELFFILQKMGKIFFDGITFITLSKRSRRSAITKVFKLK